MIFLGNFLGYQTRFCGILILASVCGDYYKKNHDGALWEDPKREAIESLPWGLRAIEANKQCQVVLKEIENGETINHFNLQGNPRRVLHFLFYQWVRR